MSVTKPSMMMPAMPAHFAAAVDYQNIAAPEFAHGITEHAAVHAGLLDGHRGAGSAHALLHGLHARFHESRDLIVSDRGRLRTGKKREQVGIELRR